MLSGPRHWLVAVPVAALLTVALTWPLTARIGSAGRLDNGDARFSVWNVGWVARALTSDPRTLFDANIFYPHGNALAFSEANLVAGILAIPAWLATGNALAATNSAILLSFVLAALAMFALVRHLTVSLPAAGLAALFFAFSPYAFSRLGHIQLLMTFGLPWTLLYLHRFVEAPGPRRAAALGVVMAITALACGYYGIFMGLTVGWGLLWVIAALITLPFMLPYAEIRSEGFARSLDDARMFSADWRSYLASPKLAHEWILPLLGEWQKVLFPGALVLGFALATVIRAGWSAAASLRSPTLPSAQDARPEARSLPEPHHAVVTFYASIAVLAAWASFGPNAGLYTLFFHTLPFFELIRAPGRFGVLVTLALSVLAAFSIAALFATLVGGRRRAVLGLVTATTLATSTVGPLYLVAQPPMHPVYQRLAQMPRGAVVEFPFFIAGNERHRHIEYMLESTRHWQPLLNGYSDHMPPEAWTDSLLLAEFPSDDAWDVISRRGARYVVVHWRMAPGAAALRTRLFANDVGVRVRTVLDRPDISLFELMPGTTTTP